MGREAATELVAAALLRNSSMPDARKNAKKEKYSAYATGTEAIAIAPRTNI